MKILIVGSEPQQEKVLESLGIKHSESLEAGQTLEHTFITKYFTQDVGVWIDRYESLQEWVEAYLSPEAREVRESLAAVIFTEPLLEPAASFAEALDGTLVASTAGYEDDYIASVPFDELLDSVHAAIADFEEPESFNDLDGASGHEGPEDAEFGAFEQPSELLEPLLDNANAIDLTSIAQALKEARNSDMSDAQKRQLAEDLAKQLVP